MNFNDNLMEEAKHSKIEILRRKIKKMVEKNQQEGDVLLKESDNMKFIHEIEVQQLELELQNEELTEAGKQEIIAAQKYADLYNLATLGYYILSPQGIIKEINLSGANLLGKERSSLNNSSFGFFVSNDTRPDFNHFLSEIFTSKEKKTCDVIFTDKGSEPIYVSLTGIADQNGEQCYLTAIDITDRKRTEQELNESENKFKNLVWDMQVGVLIQGPQSEILFSNPQALEYLGLNEDQLLGKTSFDPDWNVIHEDGSPFPGNTHPVPQAIATGLPVRDVVMGVYHPVNGNRVWLLVDALPQHNSDGNIHQVVCCFIDISRRKRAEEELMESNTKFQSIFENNSTAMAIISPDSTILMVNDEYCKMIGFTRQEVIGTSWTKQIPSDDLERLLEYNRRRLVDPKNAPDKYEFTFYKKNGETGHSYMSVSMYSHTIIASFIDITSRIKAEQDLKKKMDELLHFQRLTVDRELKMIELKKEVNELLKSSGKDEKYRIVE